VNPRLLSLASLPTKPGESPRSRGQVPIEMRVVRAHAAPQAGASFPLMAHSASPQPCRIFNAFLRDPEGTVAPTEIDPRQCNRTVLRATAVHPLGEAPSQLQLDMSE
jgi:hypothetical protein